MNLMIKKALLFIYFALLFCFAGSVFNTVIAFVSIWIPEMQLITATLTGYGLFRFVTKGK